MVNDFNLKTFPPVVPFSLCKRIASLTDYSKVCWKTHNSVHKYRRMCFPVVINSRKAKGNILSVNGNALEVFSLDCEAAGLTTSTYSTFQGLSPCLSSASLQMVSWCLLFSFSSL